MRTAPARPRAAPNADLGALLARFPRARVAVVGDLVADEYVLGETERVSREAPVLIVRYERSELKAGCAANAVMNLCALGARVRALGFLGADGAGERLSALLRGAGADLSGVQVVRKAATATKTRILAGGKNTRRQQIVRLDRDGPGAPEGRARAALLGALEDAARECDAILVSDYGLGTLEAARGPLGGLAAKVQVCVDARYDLRRYRGARLLKPNEVELEQAVARPLGGDPHALDEAGRGLLAQVGAEALLVTRGRRGMALVQPGEPTLLLAAHGSREAVDVTGAGDTVMAVTTLGLASGAAPAQAARLANVAGALVVLKPGTATVTAAELRAELAAGPAAAAVPLGRRGDA